MYLTGQRGLELGFARALRVAFRHHHDYMWDPDATKSKIHIYDEFPLSSVKYPSVTIDVAGGPALLRGIGDEVGETIGTEVAIDGLSYTQQNLTYHSGNLRPTVNIEIRARTSIARSEIADWIVLFIRHFAVEKFRNEGVEIQDVSLGSQSSGLQGSDPLYRTSIQVVCLTSFYREIPIAQASTLAGLCLTGIFSTLPNGVTLTEVYV